MNKKSDSAAYAAAGVNINAGYEAVERMKKHIARTRTEGVCSDIGGFGGLFAPDLSGMKKPILISGTDGVGTKLRLAFLMDKHDTVGIDCVAMCVNDVICCGAKPLFFLDYIACGKNVPERIEQVVAGVAEGCVQAGAALIGGETAEMPGFYPEDEYDLAGYCTGLVDQEKMIDPQRVTAGDVVIALPSNGVHSNGFSLVRKVFDVENTDLTMTAAEYIRFCGLDEGCVGLSGRKLKETCALLNEETIGSILLAPTRIYVQSVLALMEKVDIKGLAHITGGGFYENIPRAIPDGLYACISRSAVRIHPVFDIIAAKAKISEKEMFSTFNMGVGMTVIVPAQDADQAIRILRESGEDAYVIGEIGESDSQGEKVIMN